MTLIHRTLSTRSARLGILLAALMAAGINGPATLLAAAPAAAPSQAAPQTRPATRPAGEPAKEPAEVRSMEQVVGDLNVAAREVNQSVSGVAVLFDPAKRKEAAPKALPVMKRMSGLIDEVVAVEPRAAEQMRLVKLELEAMMALLGDPDAASSIRKTAVSVDPDEAARGKAWQIALNWAAVGKNVNAQEKLATELGRLARSNHRVDMIAQVAELLSSNAASPALTQQLEEIIIKDLDGELAERMKVEVEQRRKLRQLIDRPIVVRGARLDGGEFTSADWKGKVVLVDFWATWCAPCVAEMPRLKKLYAKHHDQGFEIVGVSWDENVESLKEYLSSQDGMPWPQLFDSNNPGVHAVAKQFGVATLPTMFLIDKKGKVRHVKAQQENLEELIPKLLAE
jgi:thiol-disulfide isomerase/thioredoxin